MELLTSEIVVRNLYQRRINDAAQKAFTALQGDI